MLRHMMCRIGERKRQYWKNVLSSYLYAEHFIILRETITRSFFIIMNSVATLQGQMILPIHNLKRQKTAKKHTLSSKLKNRLDYIFATNLHFFAAYILFASTLCNLKIKMREISMISHQRRFCLFFPFAAKILIATL